MHIYNGILLSHKKEWNNAICSHIDGPRVKYTEWSKSDRERQISYNITYMWNLKYDTNEFIYKIESQTANKFMVTKGERGEKLGVWN